MGGNDELRSAVRHTVHVLQQSQLSLRRECGFGFIHKIEAPSRAGQENLQKTFAVRHLVQTGHVVVAATVLTGLRRQREEAFRTQEKLDGPIARCRYTVIASARSDVSSYVLNR